MLWLHFSTCSYHTYSFLTLINTSLSVSNCASISVCTVENKCAYIDGNDINCNFNYFSDDFYFFCNENDTEKIITIFDNALEKYDFNRKENKYTIWNYETYNSYNILTRYWKATIRHWNLEVLKDYENARKHSQSTPHKLVFLNQIIYRLSSLTDEKSKRTFITNFFKTKY